jgi:hypothetical protein
VIPSTRDTILNSRLPPSVEVAEWPMLDSQASHQSSHAMPSALPHLALASHGLDGDSPLQRLDTDTSMCAQRSEQDASVDEDAVEVQSVARQQSTASEKIPASNAGLYMSLSICPIHGSPRVRGPGTQAAKVSFASICSITKHRCS